MKKSNSAYLLLLKKNIILIILSIFPIIGFSQSSKLWFTTQANAGTEDQVGIDLMIVNGTTTFDLSSSNVNCVSSSNGNAQTYQISVENDYDKDGTMDQISFDLVVKGYENSTTVYSEAENASSMTALGIESDISTGSNVWGVNSSDNNSDVDEKETMIFSVENIVISNLAAKYEPKFEGFSTMRFEEPKGSREHKIIIGEGENLRSFLTNFPIDYELVNEEKIVVTGAGSFVEGGTHEWALSSVKFSITINDTESGGFNDLDDYSLFSNASNFGGSYPAQAKDVPKSEFCWDKIPRWLALRSLTPLTDAEVIDVATNYQVVMLEKANNQGTEYVDDGMVAVATRLKAENPNLTTLFYWNSWIHYGGYRANDDYNANAWSDLGSDGQPELFKDLWYTYNYEEEGLRDWWVNSAVTAMENDVLDGVFVDKITNSNLIEPFTESGEPKNNYARMLKNLYEAMPEGKIVIGNSLGTERVNSNRGLFNVMDGSYLERWAFPGTALDEAEAIAISIQTMREALAKGKIIHLQTSPHDTGGNAEPDDYEGRVQYAKDNVNYALAVYLIIAEENAYFSYTSSVNANPFGNEAWSTSFIDEFSYRLGPPLGPPTKDGYIYQRSFENVDVWLDVSTKQAVLDWKDKTKITTTECSAKETSTIIEGTLVHITKRNATGFAIDGGSEGFNGKAITLSATNTSDQGQLWLEIDRGNGFYSYEKYGTNYSLDGNREGANNQIVYLWETNDTNQNQQWQKQAQGDGSYKLIKRNATGFTINGGSGAVEGRNITLWDSSVNHQNLQWFITPISTDIRIEAEDYDAMSGIQTESSTETAENVGYINNGDWLRFDDVNLTRLSNLEVRVASGFTGGTIEVRTGSVTGTLLGNILVTNTGGNQNWVTENTSLSNAIGTQDVYLVFTGGNDFLFNVNWIEFNNSFTSNKDVTIFTKAADIIIYPNPVVSTTTVENAANSNIIIYDMNGSLVYSVFISSDNETINLSVLATGVYYARVENQSGGVSVVKVVKQ